MMASFEAPISNSSMLRRLITDAEIVNISLTHLAWIVFGKSEAAGGVGAAFAL
jgi:hypothetical protein